MSEREHMGLDEIVEELIEGKLSVKDIYSRMMEKQHLPMQTWLLARILQNIEAE